MYWNALFTVLLSGYQRIVVQFPAICSLKKVYGSGVEGGSELVFDSELEFAPDTGDTRGFFALGQFDIGFNWRFTWGPV